MVKSLQNRCLLFLSEILETFKEDTLKAHLLRHQKEFLIKRILLYDGLSPEKIRFVKMSLLCSNLTTLELGHCDLVDDSLLKEVSKRCRLLEYISVVKCKNVTDIGLASLLQNQKNLIYLKLKRLHAVTGTCLSYVNTKKLQTLILAVMAKLKDQYVVVVISNAPTVVYLGLHDNGGITDVGVMGVIAILKDKLKILKLSGSTITDRSIESMIRYSSSLERLDEAYEALVPVSVKERDFLSLMSITTKWLKLYGCNRLTNDGIDKLLTSLPLKNVDISYCCGYDGVSVDFNACSFSSSLEKLNCRGVNISSDTLRDVAITCSNLTGLVLCGIQTIDDKLLKEISTICGDRMKELDLSYCQNITDLGISYVTAKCRSLETLSIQFYTGTLQSLQPLAQKRNEGQARSLKKLLLAGCLKINEDVLNTVLPNLSSLEELNLAAISVVSDKTLHAVAKCTQLRYVNLKACKKVTDTGLCKLIQNAPLVELVLSAAKEITDKSIFMMASSISSSLEKLYVSGCNLISPHVLRYLKDVSVKGVYVQHRIPDVRSAHLMARNLDTGQFCRVDPTTLQF